MPNRYVSLILELDEQEAKEAIGLANTEDLARPSTFTVPTRQLVAAWVTDYQPLDPNAETRHLLQLRPDTWVLEHPMACRAQAPLDTCPVFRVCEQSPGLADGAVLGRLGVGWYAVSTNKTGGLHFNLERVDR